MSTEATPAVVAASAAPVVSEAPAAAPETPSAPVTPESIADSAPNSAAAIDQWVAHKAEERAHPVEEKPAEAAPVEQAPPVEAQKPEEIAPDGSEKAAEEVKTEEKPEEAKQPEFNVEDYEGIAPKELADKIKANVELSKALDADPKLKGELFRTARIAAELAPLREIFPDVETAQQAAQHASQYMDFDQSIMGAQTLEGTQSFIGKIAEAMTLVDAEGNPVKDARGNTRYHEAFPAFLDNFRKLEFDHMRKQLNTVQDPDQREQLTAALDVISEWIAPSSQAKEELPAHLQQRLADVDRREQELHRQEQQRVEAQHKESMDRARTRVEAEYEKIIDPVLKRAALDDFTAKAARKEIENVLVDKLNANSLLESAVKNILRTMPPGAERESKLFATNMKYIQSVLPGVIREIMPKAAAPVLKAQDDRQAKQTAQVQASRSEPKGSATAKGPSAPQDPTQMLNQAIAEWSKANNGQEPSQQQMLEIYGNAKAKQRAVRV